MQNALIIRLRWNKSASVPSEQLVSQDDSVRLAAGESKQSKITDRHKPPVFRLKAAE